MIHLGYIFLPAPTPLLAHVGLFTSFNI